MTVSPMGIFPTTLICSFLPQDDQSCFSWLWFFHVTCRQNMQCHGSYGPKTQLVAGWPPNRITRLRNDPGSGRRPWDKNGGFAQYAEHAPSISKQQCSSVQRACSSKLCQSSNVTELTSIKEPKYQIFFVSMLQIFRIFQDALDSRFHVPCFWCASIITSADFRPKWRPRCPVARRQRSPRVHFSTFVRGDVFEGRIKCKIFVDVLRSWVNGLGFYMEFWWYRFPQWYLR